ncbi:hypothetical protein [Sphingobium mellinum]|uniref:hypothetical protein n=1 Tax=Sphingobium mellinum TaxID=1387166 RepID=UPI0030EF2D0D
MGTRRRITGSLRMRVLFAMPLLLLAACENRDGDKSGISTNIVEYQATTDTPGAAPEPDANSADASASSADAQAGPPHPDARAGSPTATIPVSLQGRWTGLNDVCGDRSADLELTVKAGSLIFHESVGTVKGVASGANGSLRIDAAFTGEGDSWSKTLQLRPSASGRELTIINDGRAVTRKRC